MWSSVSLMGILMGILKGFVVLYTEVVLSTVLLMIYKLPTFLVHDDIILLRKYVFWEDWRNVNTATLKNWVSLMIEGAFWHIEPSVLHMLENCKPPDDKFTFC